MTVEPGHYTLEYTDENGETQQRGGGGVAFEPDGTERPLTPEELMEHLNAPEVSYEDGSTITERSWTSPISSTMTAFVMYSSPTGRRLST